MFHVVEKSLTSAIAERLKAKYGLDLPVTLEQPKQPSFGELALPVAFQLARQLRKAPKAIAEELAALLSDLPGVASVEVAGGGYLNLRLSRSDFGTRILTSSAHTFGARAGKTIVEHTNINPNKAAHIGHLRNAVLGDTFVRMLRATGEQVEVQNYIDNTGVQVADVVVGFHFLENKSVEDVRALIAQPKFDYYCWDLYARTSQYYTTNPEAVQWRRDTLHAIEHGEGILAELGHLIADAIVECHFDTMWRLGIVYDVLPRESEIIHLQFWATAFEQLKQRGAVFFVDEGKNKGCWAMAASHFKDVVGEETDDDAKVIVRSNGTVTYVGKDIAYQMWKFGLLGKDFHYEPFRTYPNGHEAWVASPRESVHAAPPFGKGARVYNVIDSRQSYLQDVVVAGLRALQYEEAAANSVHFSYEMVALTPRTCAELSIHISDEERNKPYVEVAGRKGRGVKADDLIDKLIEKALAEVDSRHAEKDPAERRTVAEALAIGSLRYFLLKFTRNTVIAFDLQEALSFEGETGPYVQYAAVRARNIFRKLEERGGALPDFASVLTPEAFARQLGEERFWQLLLSVAKHDSALAKALESGEPSNVAKYAFNLAQAFNSFYHDNPVLAEEDPERRAFLLWMTTYFRDQFERTLTILGIPAPAYM